MSAHAVKWKQVKLKTTSFLQKCLIENKNLDVIIAYFWPRRSRVTQQSLWIMFTSEIFTFVFSVFKEKVDFPTEKTQSDFGFSFSFPLYMCACVCTHTCMHTLLSRPRCLGFYWDHRPFTATIFTVTVQVWLIIACMRRDSRQTRAVQSAPT